MAELKIRAPASDLFYVTIDGTRAVDSLAIGRLWQKFGWRNLLDGLKTAAADKERRTDTAHPDLPIRFMKEARAGKGTTMFQDIVLMPEGIDGSGTDPGNWPSSTAAGNAARINAANRFVQGFVLSPACDPGRSALGSGARRADLVYVSSHGVRTGDMFGAASNDIDEVDPFFILAKAAATGGKFDGPKWLILSNCNTLVPQTHNDWLTLMGASPSFRGILGYQGPSVAADPSAGANITFVNRLLTGTSLRDAWRQANKAWGMTQQWVVLCHDAAKDDTIQQWNDGKLPAVPLKPPVVKQFDEANPSGVAVARRSDPFAVFWSRTDKGVTTRITPANRYGPGNKIATGNDVAVTVAAAPKAAAFAAGTVIEVTLIFVREDYPEPIDVDTMFSITKKTGIQAAVTTAHRNAARADKGKDTWVMTVDATAPASVTLGLHIDRLFMGDVHHNLPYWLRAKFTAPDGSGAPSFDFIHDAAVYTK